MRVGRGRRPVWIGGGPWTLVAEDLATPGRVAVLVFRLGLQLVPGHVDHDLLAVVLNVQVGPGDLYLALTEPEKAADADQDAVDVAIGGRCRST